MRIVLFLVISFISQVVHSQPPANYFSILESFKNHYNDGDYMSVFDMFGQEMKDALPKNDALVFLDNIKKGFGTMGKSQYLYYKAPFHLFKTECDYGILSMHISVSAEDEIVGLYIISYKEPSTLSVPSRNLTEMILPFKGTWYVFWGGDTEEQNYHVVSQAQKNAFDFVVVDSQNRTYENQGRVNEDYYAWGKEVLAPCNAEVIMAVDGVWDNIPGQMNPDFVPGNCVFLKTNQEEFILLVHLMKGSVLPKEGQLVKKGDVVGRCGNSGNSSEAHIHFHVQNSEDLQEGIGIKTYFHDIIVNGVLQDQASPVRGDLLTPK